MKSPFLFQVALAALLSALAGCSGSFSILGPGRDRGPVAQTPPIAIESPTQGELPVTCFVRARSFKGLVPLSCDEAQLARP